MFNRSRLMLVGALTGLLSGLAEPEIPRAALPPRPRKAKVQRAWWRSGTRDYRVPNGGGASECARRRRQIEAGTLMTSAGEQRLREARGARNSVTS